MLASLISHPFLVFLMAIVNIVAAQEGCYVCVPHGAPSSVPNPSAILTSPPPGGTIPEPPPVFVSTSSPTSPTTGCNMCRQPGYTINNPIGTMSVPGYLNGLSYSCYYVQQQAALGTFDEATCELLPDLVDESCGGCKNGAPTAYPPIHSLPNSPSAVPLDYKSSNSTDKMYEQSYFWFLVVGLGTLAAAVGVCFMRTKNPAIQEGQVEMAGTNNMEGSSEEEQAAAQLAMDEKLRPLVLQTLFPEQKGSITDTEISSGLDESENKLGEQAPCSICLEPLGMYGQNDSVVVGSSCSHVYHRDCIIQWLSKKVNKNKKQYHDDCPNCRQRMWDPDTYQLVKESIIRQQELEQEQPLPTPGPVVLDDTQEVHV